MSKSLLKSLIFFCIYWHIFKNFLHSNYKVYLELCLAWAYEFFVEVYYKEIIFFFLFLSSISDTHKDTPYQSMRWIEKIMCYLFLHPHNSSWVLMVHNFVMHQFNNFSGFWILFMAEETLLVVVFLWKSALFAHWTTTVFLLCTVTKITHTLNFVSFNWCFIWISTNMSIEGAIYRKMFTEWMKWARFYAS